MHWLGRLKEMTVASAELFSSSLLGSSTGSLECVYAPTGIHGPCPSVQRVGEVSLHSVSISGMSSVMAASAVSSSWLCHSVCVSAQPLFHVSCILVASGDLLSP